MLNSKSEARNSKQIRNNKFQCFKFETFKIGICFPGPSFRRSRTGGFRVSNFGLLQHRRKLSQQRGAILIFALWVLSFLAVLAANLGYGVRQKMTFMKRIEERSQMNHIAQGGVKVALAVLTEAAGAAALVGALRGLVAGMAFAFGAGSASSGVITGGLSGHSSGAASITGWSSGRFRSSRISRKAASASAPRQFPSGRTPRTSARLPAKPPTLWPKARWRKRSLASPSSPVARRRSR